MPWWTCSGGVRPFGCQPAPRYQEGEALLRRLGEEFVGFTPEGTGGGWGRDEWRGGEGRQEKKEQVRFLTFLSRLLRGVQGNLSLFPLCSPSTLPQIFNAKKQEPRGEEVVRRQALWKSQESYRGCSGSIDCRPGNCGRAEGHVAWCFKGQETLRGIWLLHGWKPTFTWGLEYLDNHLFYFMCFYSKL